MAYNRKWQEQLNNALEKDEAELNKRLTKIYENESSKLQKEIDHYFSKYGADNVVKFRTLKESLDDADRKLLFEAYDEFVGKYPQYVDLLPVRESIYKLDRLQGLEYSIKIQQAKIGAIETDAIQSHLLKSALRGANKTAEELGMGVAFYSERSDIIKNVVGTNWSKSGNFSKNIWSNREKLSNTINNDVAQAFARGDSRKKIVEQIDKRFNSGKKNAERLVYTEGTFVYNEAQAKVLEQWFEYYSISTADSRACPVCKDLQAQQEIEYARFDEREAGVNFPPLHPWCRCTFNVQVDKRAWMKRYIETGGDPLRIGDVFKGATGVSLASAVVNKSSTIKDARERSRGLATEVKGVERITNIDGLDAVSETVENMYNNYGVNKLQLLEFNNRGKRLMCANARQLTGKTDFINGTKKLISWEDYCKAMKERVEYYKTVAQNYRNDGLDSIAKKYEKAVNEINEELKYSRWGIEDSYDDFATQIVVTTSHEFGHIISDQRIGMINGFLRNRSIYSDEQARSLRVLVKDTFKKAKANGDIYNISCYAKTDADEFFSECFAMREIGEKLPDYIEQMLVEVTGK